MTELDLELKAASRRLLWRMGYSTRVDVVLRAAKTTNAEGGKRKAMTPAPQAFTDLDVLGVAVTPSSAVRTSIVDCKTGGSSVISRMFWLRGLAEFFDADDAYMVRDRAITKDARQLAARLSLTALTDREVASLEGLHQQTLPLDTDPLSKLFDPAYIARVMDRTTSLDKRLGKLLDYRQFDYWVYPEHRNLIEMVDVLLASKDWLDGTSPIHTGIVLDCAWLYVVSLARCLAQVRTVHISDLTYGLSEYLAGGAAQLQQKKELASLLEQMKAAKQIPGQVKVNVNPRFFAPLLELLVRLLRRTDSLTDVLRILEFQSTMSIGGDRIPAEAAFGREFDRIAAKLAVDVVAFLVAAADLDPAFTATAHDLLTGESAQRSKNDASTSEGAVASSETDVPHASVDGEGKAQRDSAGTLALFEESPDNKGIGGPSSDRD